MTRSILIAEDSATQAERLRMLLEEAGYEVTVARSGEEALERLEDSKFNLVLSDIMMPGISGYELCRRVKQRDRSDMPVVLLTSLTDPTDIVRGLEAGADNYITKPYDPENLLTRIERVLTGRRLRQPGRTTMGVDIVFLGSRFSITSEKEQILDLLLSSVEDIVRANHTLAEQQRQLAEAHERLEDFARSKAEEAQVSTVRYRALMQKAGDAILVLDAGAVVIEANARAAELFGRPLDELHGRQIRQILGSEQDGEVLQERVARLAEGAELANVEYRFTRADGRVIYCEVSASTAAPHGTDLILMIVHDVTARRLAEEQLRRSERQLAEAQRLAQLGSWEWDFETGRLVASDEMARIYDLSFDGGDDAWLSTIMSRIVPEDRERVQSAIDEARGKAASMEIQYRIRTFGDAVKTIVARWEAMTDSEGTVRRLFGTLQDVTAQVAAAEALRLSEEQLRQAQRMEAIGRLTGGIAHDFNNMLTAIKCGTQLLLMDAAEESSVREELEQIDLAASRAATLTRQLLAFSRKQVIQPTQVDLNVVVDEMKGMLHRLIGEDVELRTALDPALGHALTDRGQMEQVLINLVVNARDAMPEGGSVTISTWNVKSREAAAMERDLAPGAYVRLSVSDTGSGMTPAVVEHIFEPFFTTKGPGQGTGLGLSTVYGIVTQMGGTIWVDTEPGRGSTFTVLLPRSAGEVSMEIAAVRPPTAVAGSETILLVEDEAMVRRLARRNLQSRGFQVLEAANGAEALAIAARHQGEIDVLLTDVVMPGISGRELAEKLRSERPDVQVVYMSGYIDDAIARHGVLNPGIALVEKPFTAEGLAEMIRTVLQRRPNPAQGMN